jgi:hypothetical protein
MAPPVPKYTSVSADPASTSDAEMLLGLQNSPYSHPSGGSHHSYDGAQNMASPSSTRHDSHSNSYDFAQSSPSMFPGGSNGYLGLGGVGDMMMESQEIDMSTMGNDMMPWLEYLPQDVLNFFDNANGNGNGMNNGGI